MANGIKSSEFEWLDVFPPSNPLEVESFQFLKKGYLHVMETTSGYYCNDYSSSTLNKALTLVRKLSDPSFQVSLCQGWMIVLHVCLSGSGVGKDERDKKNGFMMLHRQIAII